MKEMLLVCFLLVHPAVATATATDLFGSFRITLGTDTSIPLQPWASASEVATSLMAMPSIQSPVTVDSSHDDHYMEWLITFSDSAGDDFNSLDVDLSNLASSNPLDNLSYSVTTEAEALLSDSYGSAYLYTDAITCGSIHLRCRQPFATKPVAAGASREHLPSSPRPRVASAVPSTSTTRVHLPLSTYPSQR